MADSLFAIAGLSVVEGYFLQRTAFIDHTFRTVCLGAFGVNLVLLIFWNLVIYPFFVNPLRHLPQVKVIMDSIDVFQQFRILTTAL